MEDPSSIATHPEAVIKKYDGGTPTAADKRSKDESRISSSSMFFSYENPCYYLEVVLRNFFSCLGLNNRSSDPSSSSSSSSSSEEEEKGKEESKETITEDVPPPTETEDVPPPTETEEQTEDVEGPLLLSGSRAVRRPPRPPVGTGRPPQHN